MTVQIFCAFTVSARNDVRSWKQVLAEVGMGINPRIWDGDHNSVAAIYALSLEYLQVVKVPLLASN